MHALILTVQTLAGAYQVEAGHYPDFDECKKAETRHIAMVVAGGDVLKVIGDCRELYPELREI